MGKAYKEIMEHVSVSEQMRQRILDNLETADLRPRRGSVRAPVLRRYWAAAACAAILLVGAAVLPRYWDLRQPGQDVTTVVPRFTEAASLAELEEIVGFPVEELPWLPFTVTETLYTAYDQKLAEIKYCGETETAVLRKAPGTEDPSGDYTQYPEEQTRTVSGISVTLKGEGSRYVLALWQTEDYTYSLRLTEGADPADWEALLTPLFE